MLDYLHRRCLTYFLCEFNPRSRKQNTKDVVKAFLRKDFSIDKIAEYLDVQLSLLQADLVNEFNSRFSEGRPLRFQIVDEEGIGKAIQGYYPQASKTEIAFQNALSRITAEEFELLTAVILRMIGCNEVFFTPTSHDQGVDAFGHQLIMSAMPYGITHHLTWIAQAKHYHSTNVSTGEIRELVGSKELLLARAFSTVDERYKELRLRNYAPTALALITAEEIPLTVRRLAENAGVFVFAASDLFHLLSSQLPNPTVTAIRRLLSRERKSIPTLR